MNRKISPSIKDAVDFSLTLKPYQSATLDNGIPVYMVDAGSQEVVSLEIVFPAGKVFEDDRKLSAVTNSLLKNGTKTRSALEINEAFDYYGAFCKCTRRNESADISVHSLSKHLDKLLPVLLDMIENPVFPQEELDIYIQNNKQNLQVAMKKCDYVGDLLIDRYVFGPTHPYGSYTRLEDLDRITREDVVSFYNQHYVNAGVRIFVAGRLPNGIVEMLNASLGKIKAKAPEKDFPLIPVHPAEEKKFRVTNDDTAVQGAIRIASPFPGILHEDYADSFVLNTLFGGFFGSRLMRNIREDKGYTYGIHSFIQSNMHQSAWQISTEAGKEVCEAAIKEVYTEMEKLRNEKIDTQELLLVKNYIMGIMLSSLDGPFKIMSRWRRIVMNNLPDDHFQKTIATIKNASPQKMQELANKYLRPENFYELVVY